MTVRILTGDVRKTLLLLPDDSVDCVVTSPPYWLQRDYGHPDQLGMEPTVQEYVAAQTSVFREVRRILKPTGTAWINIGDAYAANAGGSQGSSGGRFGRKIVHKRTMSRISGGLKRKDLSMVPNRLAISLQDDGWYVRSEIIWAKTSPVPESAQDRPTRSHEKIWLLTKSESYWYDGCAVREDSGANLRDVWRISAQPSNIPHVALMPPDLVERCIRLGCPEGGRVLDPFGGAGTTGLVAERIGRNATLIEVSPRFSMLAHGRIADDAPALFPANISHRALYFGGDSFYNHGHALSIKVKRGRI